MDHEIASGAVFLGGQVVYFAEQTLIQADGNLGLALPPSCFLCHAVSIEAASGIHSNKIFHLFITFLLDLYHVVIFNRRVKAKKQRNRPVKREKMVNVSITMRPAQAERFKEFCRSKDRRFSDVAREALEARLASDLPAAA
jgi:hypothetical protein